MASASKPVSNHFNFCPSCGSESVGPSCKIAIMCDACGFEIYFSPSTSAAALIEDANGNLLVTIRKNNPQKGKYGLPGGFVDPNETLENALAREVKEEVNLELVSWTFLGGWPNDYPFKSVVHSVVDTYFLAKVHNFDSINACNEELESFAFIDPRQVVEDDWAFTSLKNAVQKYLEIRYIK